VNDKIISKKNFKEVMMGRFVNPDNSAFQVAVASEIYIDKTGMLAYTNKVLGTKQALICNSRPRRFGKSTTADMLTAYYSRGADSKNLFAGYEISNDKNFSKYLNKYDVIHLDIQWCMMDAGSAENTVSYINKNVIGELKKLYPEIEFADVQHLYGALSKINAALKQKFIIIIDEWDVLVRDEATNTAVQEEYINFLRGLFKGAEPEKYLALAYLTGILPIKKIKTQSALNNFEEFTMLAPGGLASYFGFTEAEVQGLCAKYNVDFTEVKRWYDGYFLGNEHIYNPKAVVSVMLRKEFQSYWSQTGTYAMIVPLINMDFDGLKAAIIEMLSGDIVSVNAKTFQNDMVNFTDRDDVLTVLIHLGYLAYNQKLKVAFIPNEEIREEFLAAVKRKKWNELVDFQRASKALLNATLDMDAEAVAKYVEKIHQEYASVIQYNDENSLSSVLAIAYLSAMEYYFKPIRELPTGRGFADFVFLPKAEYAEGYPALLVELKWNQSAEAALAQIKEKKYPESLVQYTGNILLVGINYDKKNKKHQCLIEEMKK
jgi:hypothetical protein